MKYSKRLSTSDSVKLLVVNGPWFEGTQEITASYTDQDSGKQVFTAGKLDVVGYDNGTTPHNVIIVPVNGAQLNGSGIGQLQATLNKIYGQVCETFVVNTGPNLSYSNQSFDANPPDAVSYSADMITLIDTLKDTIAGSYNDDNFYLFLLDHCAGSDKAGIMPFNQNFGFIFVQNQSGAVLERTIAHELGHGAFGLLHTFHTYGHEAQLDSATTDNLMDYAGGSHLFKYQWDEIYNPVCYNETCFGTGTTGADVASIEGGTLLETNIEDIINQIRQGNSDQKDELPMQITTGIGEYDKITLGSKDYSYIKMITTGFNSLTDKQPTTTIQTNTGTETIPTGNPLYNIMPSENSKTTYTEDGTKYIKYKFHELQTKQNEAPYADTKEATGTTRVEIWVKNEESSSFEDYIYARLHPDILLSIVWVDQTNSLIKGVNNTAGYGKCTYCSPWPCKNTCCLVACQYMVKSFGANPSSSNITCELADGQLSVTNSNNYVIIDKNLEKGSPVIVGVNETGQAASINNNPATNHYIVIIGRHYDKDGVESLYFHDPGTTHQNFGDGSQKNNILIFDKGSNMFQGKKPYSNSAGDIKYTITEIYDNN